MKFILWLSCGLLLGPSAFNLSQPPGMGVVAQIAGALFLFFAGWEIRFINWRQDRRFYAWTFLGSFGVPFLAGYFFFEKSVFIAVALAISALPVAVQILREKGLYNTPLGHRAITLASVCDVCAWVIMAFLLPQENVGAWIVSHGLIFAFFVGVLAGFIRPLPESPLLSFLQKWIFVPVFFITLGWGIDILGLFSFEVFLKLFIASVIAKSLGTYAFSRLSGESARFSFDISILLNARGAMEILAAHYAYRAQWIEGDVFAGLVMIGVVTSLMAVPLLRPHL
ncbi:MAG: cation:proton antiporter [Bdellovibrio sp.]